MNGNAGLRFTGFDDCMMHMLTIHAFPSELRQQSRMNIDDFIGKCINNCRRYFK